MTSEQNLDSRYLDWLYSQVAPNATSGNPARSYWLLLEQLHNLEFDWSVPNDDNRLEDGKDLREEFLAVSGAKRDQKWMGQSCSLLEVLIALSRRAEFESAKDSYTWFWQMIDNIGLRDYTDNAYDDWVRDEVDQVINCVVHRDYSSDGTGGLFPLRHPDCDQREVELWYQMSSYLLENGYE